MEVSSTIVAYILNLFNGDVLSLSEFEQILDTINDLSHRSKEDFTYLKTAIVLTNEANVSRMEPTILVKGLLGQLVLLVVALEQTRSTNTDLTVTEDLDRLLGTVGLRQVLFGVLGVVVLLRNIRKLEMVVKGAAYLQLEAVHTGTGRADGEDVTVTAAAGS